MIQLTEEDYIAEGLERKCYFHPTDDSLCVKIGKEDVDPKRLDLEIDYFNKIKKKNAKNYSYPFYSDFHGKKTTNYGIGYIYDIVRDEQTKGLSLTLRDYLEMPSSPISDDLIIKALERLKNEMITHKIFVGDLRARNLCCKILKDNTIQLIVIDGIGHRDFFPFADYFSYFAKRKVERRFLKANLHSLEAQRKLLKQLRASGEVYV